MRFCVPFNPIVLALALLAATCSVKAGPIQSDPLTSSAEQPPLLLPAAAPLAESVTAQPGPLLSSPRAASAVQASGSELAADVMREAEIGDGATHTRAPLTLRPASAASGGKSMAGKHADRQDGAELPSEFRAFGKATWSWVKSILPWNADDPIDLEGEDAVSPTQINWSDEASAAEGTHNAPVLQAANAATAHNSSAGGGDPASHESGLSATDGRNLVREAMRVIAQVVDHPMTWLIASLIVIGGFAVSLADRRPK